MVESCIEGVKKPEHAIFDLTLKKLGVDAHEVVFLDDLGDNLKTARLMGMSTIKVGVYRWYYMPHLSFYPLPGD